MVSFRCAAVLLACLLCGCASLSPEDAERDRALKAFETQPDVAGLYIYCDEWMGTMPRSNVSIDGRPLGQIGSRSFLYTTLETGAHRITATAGDTDEVQIDAEPGHNYYVRHEPKLGFFYPGVKLHVVDESEGRAGTKRAQFARPTYQEEDLQSLKRRMIAAAFLVHFLGALPGAAAGGGGIGIGTFLH